MKHSSFLFVIVLSLTIIGCQAPPPKKPVGIDLSLMDTSVRPQDDFYNYVNGSWMAKSTIPDDKTSWGSFNELRENTDADVLALLKTAAKKEFDEGSDEGKAIVLFNLINDTITRDTQGIEPLKPILEIIDNINSLEGVQQYLIEAEPYGGGGVFGFYIFSDAKDSNKNAPHIVPGALGIERDYYLKNDDDSKKVKEQYEAHVATMFGFLGKSEEDAKVLAATVIKMETKMAAARMDKVARRVPSNRYNPTSIEGLQKLVSSVSWNTYFNGIGAKDLDTVIVTDQGYFDTLNELLTKNSIEDWKVYLKWSLIDQSASQLSTEMDTANWEFYSKTLRGAKAQELLEKRALRTINRDLGEPLGKLYVGEKFPPAAKEQMKELVGNLIKAYEARINDLEWMDSDTKAKAIEKLTKTTVKVGYPDKWKDYSNLSLKDENGHLSYFMASANITKFNFDKDLDDLKNPVDKTQWFMSPQTVNAYYNPLYNEIVFPAAILQPPFFNFEADAAVNYGGIGAVIGHEISHGFDDSGANYDADGNLVNWWTESDLEEFNGLGDKLADQFSAIEVLPDTFINGKFTLGENIGDLGGVHAAFDALKIHFDTHGKPEKIDNFSPEERFFLSWGTVWRVKFRDEALKNRVKTDPHSPGVQRASQPLKNMDAFYTTFGIKEGDGMYLKPEDRVYIW